MVNAEIKGSAFKAYETIWRTGAGDGISLHRGLFRQSQTPAHFSLVARMKMVENAAVDMSEPGGGHRMCRW